MILVDTPVWIDHLHATDAQLSRLLVNDDIGCHPAVIEELALGSLKNRDALVELLENLWSFPVLTHQEMLALVDGHRLWGRGLSAIDAHLMGSVALVGGARLWTRDKRLRAACHTAGVPYLSEN